MVQYLAQIIEHQGSLGDLSAAEQLFTKVEADTTVTDKHLVFIAIAKIFLAHSNSRKASEILTNVPFPTMIDDLVELAVHVKKRLNKDAVDLIRRAIQLSSDDNIRNAWCWYDLANVLAWLRSPETEVLQAYCKAIELLPNEARFKEAYESWEKKRKNSFKLNKLEQ